MANESSDISKEETAGRELSLEQLDEVSGGAAQPTVPTDLALVADVSLHAFESSALDAVQINAPFDVSFKK